MPQTTLTAPSAYDDQGSGAWTPVSVIARLSDGSDATGLEGFGDGINNWRYFELSHIFTGLVAGSQISRVGWVARHKSGSGAVGKLGEYDLAGSGVYTPVSLPTGFSTSTTLWKTLVSVVADGSGNYNAKVRLGLPASLDDSWLISEAWLTVDYNRLPTAPTLTSPVGTISTLSPTFVGVHNDADGDPMSAVEIEVRRVSDNALFWASGTLSGATFSEAYAGTTLVSGTEYKWRARTKDNISLAPWGAWSAFSNFTPVTNVIPVATVVSPTGNPSIGTLTPTLQFSYFDADGDAQSGYQVEVRRFSDGVYFWQPGQQAGAVTSVVYSGTVLVGGTRYEWRVRVQDSKSAWSDYTGWASFTPQAVPNPPTSLVPSGLQNTLTPTIQGVYNQGTGAAQAGFQYEIRQGAITIHTSGDVLVVIATGQVYAGSALSWGTSYELRARSKDTNGAYSTWTAWQAFNTNSTPTTATSLQPNGAITGDTTPNLTWVHNDADGDAQTEVEIELQTMASVPVTGYDPKALSQATLIHTVDTALTASPATEYRWRIRTKGTVGPGFGPWSAWATFFVATAPVFTVSAPTVDQVVSAPELTLEWAMTGGSGVQQSWRAIVYADDQTTIVLDTGVVGGEDELYQMVSGLLKHGLGYYAQVGGEDTLDQAAQSSLIPFTTLWTPPDVITGVVVQSVGSQED